MTAVIGWIGGTLDEMREAGMAGAERGPRERMVFSAAQLIRRAGVGATGMREVAAHARAPRGSLQHYFPDGKEQLVNEAVGWAGRYAGNRVPRFLAALPEPTPSGLFSEMVRQWTDEYETEGFEGGCPVAAATVDCARTADSTRQAAEAAFTRWTDAVAGALTDMGVPEERSRPLATLMISSLEGALLIARAERSVRALTTAVRELGPLLDAAVPRPAADGGTGEAVGS
ncbi:TetR/AcrR family transcriptional regulator [Streptomyces erythrogriseus]|uniref:TetR/AcrR family transcriptional regulator n=2 Tax=Streptomyces erythrogriseus TaxID=284027 RepID=A0ABP6J8Q5_9ACTN